MAALFLALIAGAALTLLRDGAYLDTDAAQYLSTATNLLAGDGLSTDVIYYDEQYGFGDIPAPQTVFPPGLPVVLASMLAGGISPAWSSFLAGLLGFCATGILIYASLRRLSVGTPLALLASATWLGLGLGWSNVLMGRAEVAFTFVTMASALLCIEARQRSGLLLSAGVLAAMALLVRYQGLFFLFALAAWWAFPLLRRNRDGLRPALVGATWLFAVPAAVATLLALRNWSLVGAPGGGPVDTVRAGLGGTDLIRAQYWTLTELTGLSADGVMSGEVAELLVAVGVILAIVWLLRGGRSVTGAAPLAREPTVAAARTSFLRLAGLYVAVTMLAMLLLATTKAGAYLQGRFLVPLVPFVLILWALVLDRWVTFPATPRRWLLVSALCVLHTGLFFAQAEVIRTALADLRADQRLRVIDAAMKEMHEGITLKEYLRRVASREAPVFAEPGQQLWLALGRPVLAATPAGFSSREWDDQSVRVLRACYGAGLVLFFPRLFKADMPHNANKQLFLDLARGRVPTYLRRIHTGPAVEIYALEIDAAGVSCPQPRRPS